MLGTFSIYPFEYFQKIRKDCRKLFWEFLRFDGTEQYLNLSSASSWRAAKLCFQFNLVLGFIIVLFIKLE